MIRYGELLKLCRQMSNMTQAELAKKTYTTQSLISSYENGRTMPKLDIFCDLIEACGYELGIREKKDTYTAEEMIRFMEENR